MVAPDSARPGVSAVIVNFNARAHLVECVRSLRADGVDEVVVVDNASTDGSEEVLAAADPDCRFLPTGSNLGFGTAANVGVANTGADYVLILNPDTIVGQGTSEALASALDQDPLLAVVGPRIDNPDGSLYPSARRFPQMRDAAGHAFLGVVWKKNRFTRRYRMLDWDHAAAGPVDWVGGACMLVRRRAFDQVGGFDPAYFMYVEDVDLCWRLRRAGWTVGYQPAGRVVHAVGASSQLAPYRMILAHHRSLLRFANRTTTGPGRALLPAVAAGLALRTVLAWPNTASTANPPPRIEREGEGQTAARLASAAGVPSRGSWERHRLARRSRARRSYRWRTHAPGVVVVAVADDDGRHRPPRYRGSRLLPGAAPARHQPARRLRGRPPG